MKLTHRGTDTGLLFLFALLLFLPSATEFNVRPTDVSALRVLDGDVPYRDFWTMYAPGSFVTLAGAFLVFGRQLIVSNLLGIVTSAAAVAVFHRMVRQTAGAGAAAWLAALVAVAFYGTGYHDGFTSYPPAILLILAGVWTAAKRCNAPGWRWAIGPGLLIGLAALYKHDVAGYAALSAGAATLVARRARPIGPLWAPVLALGTAAAAVPLGAAAMLAVLGAGPDLFEDLVRFPLFDFRYTRGEYFPLLPRIDLSASKTALVSDIRQWAICNLPTLSAGLGLWGLWRGRRTFEPAAIFAAAFAVAAFAFHWSAAHVQLNTNAITLAAWGTLVGAIGVRGLDSTKARRLRTLALPVIAGWALLFLAVPIYQSTIQPPTTTWLDLPGLWGIRVSEDAATRWRRMATVLADADAPDVPLLFAANRNDAFVYAQPLPFWLSPRRSATRHHELHPGITDVASVQRRMLADIARGPVPVVVREHRFTDEAMDQYRDTFADDPLPRGSELLDDWIAEHYVAGERFGMYEVMRRRPNE